MPLWEGEYGSIVVVIFPARAGEPVTGGLMPPVFAKERLERPHHLRRDSTPLVFADVKGKK